MLKTTSKEFKAKVKKYILDNIDGKYLTECGYPASNNNEKITSLFNCMCDEWWKGFEKQRTPNRQEALKQYLLGLPSSFSVDFYYFDQRNILKNWFEQTEEESNKYEDNEVADMFYYQISLNFYQMYDKAINSDDNKATFKNFEIKASYKGTKKADWSSDNFNNHMVTVTNTETGEKARFEFWASIVNPVLNKEYDILNAFYCFVNDAVSGSESFENFCGELGYDSDSRTAEKI